MSIAVVFEHKGSITFNEYVDFCNRNEIKPADKHLYTHFMGIYACNLAITKSHDAITLQGNEYIRFLNEHVAVNNDSKRSCCGGGTVK